MPGVAAALLPRVASCLRGGGVAVLFVPADGGIDAAREAVRACCTGVRAALAARHRLLPHASRSATPGLGALALSLSAGVGVDVERLRPDVLDGDLLELALHTDERWPHAAADGSDDPHAAARRFFAVWTRKEAVMKALGVGLALSPVSFSAGPPTTDWHPVTTPAGSSRVRSVAVMSRHGAMAGFAAALAVSAGHGVPAAVRTFWLADGGEPPRVAPNGRRPLGDAGGFVRRHRCAGHLAP